MKLFRRIRQTLLSDNKFSKYLIYAIGEIILVVIGILIALQINTWNENRNLKTKETKVIKEIQKDLIQGADDMDENISQLKASLNSNMIVLKHMENNLPYNDSLDYHFANLYPFVKFSVNQTAYESAKITGLDIITNDSLRTSISDLYGNVFNLYRDSEENHLVKHYENYLKPMYVSQFESFELGTSAHPKNYSEFIQSTENKQILYFTVQACNSFIGMQTILKARVERILSLINEEIGK